jgi:hypothetical protein
MAKRIESESVALVATGICRNPVTKEDRFYFALRAGQGKMPFDLSVKDATRLLGALDQFLRQMNGPPKED